MKKEFIYKHLVQYYETDKMAITHHSNYIRWMEEARTDFMNQTGWDFVKIEETGVMSPVVGLSCKYKNPTTFSDVIEIHTRVKEISGVRLVLEYEMYKQDGTLSFTGTSEHCFVNREGKIVRVKRDFPEFYEMLSMLSKDVEDQ
ncbi:MAG: acyl-CoA thioesterase [Lachnospiraceae bacterium]|nr:acyl-CoA thioesterase [Lachnospiraceae bacterium]